MKVSIKDYFKASENLVKSDSFSGKIDWWLQHGPASERWIVFEWAFQLQQLIMSEYVVLCEHNRIDVTIVKKTNALQPIWRNSPAFGLQFKFWGNWAYGPTDFKKLNEDISSTDNSKYEAATILLMLWVEPFANSMSHDWLNDYNNKIEGKKDFIETLKNLTNKNIEENQTRIESCEPTQNLSSIKLQTIIFPNKQHVVL